jgi:hypothetical protein
MMENLKTEITAWLHSQRRILHMIVGISALLLYETARKYYRPFIYSNEINDFHVADTLGNSLGTVAAVFVFASLLGRQRGQDHFLIRTVTISVLVYEVAHPLLGKPVDPWDMAATMITWFFCEGIYQLLRNRNWKITSESGAAPS